MYGPKLPQSLDKFQKEMRADDSKGAESTPELPVYAVGFRSCMSHIMEDDEKPRAQNSFYKAGSNPPPPIERKEPKSHEPPDMPEGLSDEQRKMLAESMRGSTFNLLGNGYQMPESTADEKKEPAATKKVDGPERGYNFFTGLHEEMAPQPDRPDFR